MSDEIIVIGLSHRTAPIEVRERIAVPSERLPEQLRDIVSRSPTSEAVLVSTCNRVEVYAATPDARACIQAVRSFFAELSAPDISSALYEKIGEDAVTHTFRVASSLDSMVLGEPQILGQVKKAVSVAQQEGYVGALLGRCFHRAFSVAKRVRTETAVAAGTVSVSSIACELAAKIFGDLAGRRVLLVGAGKMGERATRHLGKRGASIVVINRDLERAKALALACSGEPRGFEDLASELSLADVVITSTASPRFIITPELIQGVMKARRHRPLFLIDIAVPRDVDPRVDSLDNVFLYDVDDLDKVAEENLAARRREVGRAEDIVRSEAQLFEQWRRSLQLTPTIVSLRTHVRKVVMDELQKISPRLSEPDRKAVEAMAESVVNKLLHRPLSELKQGADGPEGAQLVLAIQRLFGLEAKQVEGREENVSGDEGVPAITERSRG